MPYSSGYTDYPANKPRTDVIDQIVWLQTHFIQNYGEPIPIVIDKEVKGGLHRVKYKSQLYDYTYDGIFQERRAVGMLVYVECKDDDGELKKYYSLKTYPGTSEDQWTEVGSGNVIHVNNPKTVPNLAARNALETVALTGTATTGAGTTNVNGSGTNWYGPDAEIAVGDKFRFNTAIEYYFVESILNEGSLKTTTPTGAYTAATIYKVVVQPGDFVNVIDARTPAEVTANVAPYPASFIWDGAAWLNIYPYGDNPYTHVQNTDTGIKIAGVFKSGDDIWAAIMDPLYRKQYSDATALDAAVNGSGDEAYSSKKIATELLKRPEVDKTNGSPILYLSQHGDWTVPATESDLNELNLGNGTGLGSLLQKSQSFALSPPDYELNFTFGTKRILPKTGETLVGLKNQSITFFYNSDKTFLYELRNITLGTPDLAQEAEITTITKYAKTVTGGQWIQSNLTVVETGITTFPLSDGQYELRFSPYFSTVPLDSISTNVLSTALGSITTASGEAAFSTGSSTLASGNYSTAEGLGSKATALAARASGQNTEATNVAATASGLESKASGIYSYAGGFKSEANSHSAFAYGYQCKALNIYSVAMGVLSEANGDRGAHAIGWICRANGSYGSHAEGNSTTAVGPSSHAQNSANVAGGQNSHVGGNNSTANGISSFVHSSYSTANATTSAIIGGNNNVLDAAATNSIALGLVNRTGLIKPNTTFVENLVVYGALTDETGAPIGGDGTGPGYTDAQAIAAAQTNIGTGATQFAEGNHGHATVGYGGSGFMDSAMFRRLNNVLPYTGSGYEWTVKPTITITGTTDIAVGTGTILLTNSYSGATTTINTPATSFSLTPLTGNVTKEVVLWFLQGSSSTGTVQLNEYPFETIESDIGSPVLEYLVRGPGYMKIKHWTPVTAIKIPGGTKVYPTVEGTVDLSGLPTGGGGGIVYKTGTVLDFVAAETEFGAEATPVAGNITVNHTGAVVGHMALMIHNGTEPLVGGLPISNDSGVFHKISGSGDYVPNVKNYIIFDYRAASRINFSISQ